MEKKHITEANNHRISDYDAVLDAKFGAKGTASRAEAEEKALDRLLKMRVKKLKLAKQNSLVALVLTAVKEATPNRVCKTFFYQSLLKFIK